MRKNQESLSWILYFCDVLMRKNQESLSWILSFCDVLWKNHESLFDDTVFGIFKRAHAHTMMLVHDIYTGGCTNTVRDPALKVDCGRNLLLPQRGIKPASVLCFSVPRTLYQLSYPVLLANFWETGVSVALDLYIPPPPPPPPSPHPPPISVSYSFSTPCSIWRHRQQLHFDERNSNYKIKDKTPLFFFFFSFYINPLTALNHKFSGFKIAHKDLQREEKKFIPSLHDILSILRILMQIQFPHFKSSRKSHFTLNVYCPT